MRLARNARGAGLRIRCRALVPTALAPELKQLLPSDILQRGEVLRDDLPHAFRFHFRVPVHEAVAEPGDRRPRDLRMAVLDRLGEQACGLGERLEPVQRRVANVRIVLECRRGCPDRRT